MGLCLLDMKTFGNTFENYLKFQNACSLGISKINFSQPNISSLSHILGAIFFRPFFENIHLKILKNLILRLR